MNTVQLSPTHGVTRSMSSAEKQRIGQQAASKQNTLAELARQHHTSRQFIRRQKNKAQSAIDAAFHTNQHDVLFMLPVTMDWIKQLVIALMLLAHSSYRHIKMLVNDLFDFNLSVGKIHSIYIDAMRQAQCINDEEDLSNIAVSANDEVFHLGKPILTGIDTRSLYCYLLATEDHRDADTWAIHLLDAQDKGLQPQRMISDDASGLVSGHQMAFPSVPIGYDNFHLSQACMDRRRFFRNRLKSAITARNRLNTSINEANQSPCQVRIDALAVAVNQEKRARHLSTTIDTLISWLEHDILNKAGSTPEERRQRYDFVVSEFRELETIEPHRIKPLRILLENHRDESLAFVTVLDTEFKVLAEQHAIPIAIVWSMCTLQRCAISSDSYFFRSLPLQATLGDQFDAVEDAVMKILASTERTSSMVENLNGRIKKYCRNRQNIDQGYCNLLRFFLNHKPLMRSARAERHGKSPREILTGKPHRHWLELLGFNRFQRAA